VTVRPPESDVVVSQTFTCSLAAYAGEVTADADTVADPAAVHSTSNAIPALRFMDRRLKTGLDHRQYMA
jgi:hypothetical protein